MSKYLLCHRHEPKECGSAFAAWRGFDSPLRRKPVMASCRHGGHRVWWVVEAPDAPSALAQLPRFVTDRTEAFLVVDVDVP